VWNSLPTQLPFTLRVSVRLLPED